MIYYIVAEHLTGIIPQQIKAPKSVDSRLPVECSTTDGGAVLEFSMKEIKLTQGKVALVDDADYEWLNQWKWYANKDHNYYKWYARTNIKKQDKSVTILMHRLIMNAPEDLQVDHRNNDGLDNRKKNLRLCMQAQNQANQTAIRGVSKYKGVCWCKRNRRWVSQIVVNRKRIYLGCFVDEKQAASAYDDAAVLYKGAFAKTNKMMELL